MRPLAFVNARLLDAASGLDSAGALIVQDGRIADIETGHLGAIGPDVELIDCGGRLLHPGLIDLRVKTGEPGAEPKETLKSASRAAAAGGVTTVVVQPDTDPAIDDPARVEFILRRGAAIDSGVKVLAAGAATRGCQGQLLAEIGLMAEAGCAYVTDGDHTVADSRVLQRVLAYARGHGMAVAHRPADTFLTRGAAATSSDFSGRLGLPAAPAAAERIGLERDLALAELTGGTLIVDQVTTAGALDALRRARDRGVRVFATASVAHLSFNELDIGDYRTFAKLDPPLRAEADRSALLDAVVDGTVDIVTSAHSPAPAEDKRLPFEEAAPGGVGLETLWPALLTLHHGQDLPLLRALESVTVAPARLLGLDSGRLAVGAPADLAVTDLHTPWQVDADKLLSKSKNSPFDGRRLQGRVWLTMVAGRVVFGG